MRNVGRWRYFFPAASGYDRVQEEMINSRADSVSIALASMDNPFLARPNALIRFE